ncbi:GMC oxidoreductase [Paracoccus aminophilus]|uniref:Glucose-methanol-choline oxidoreductase n=1 Tax=Paracoccus aminophilus JCM 7686 TaxID=1367847 RepID=S5Y6R9_PARAH|nr:GMC family oxidoreductase [Paracoccus aminophilus]AGT11285.1 glucose-methanol-choline oxidoreductase [Paracoccus aminophilus JCM 7686]
MTREIMGSDWDVIVIGTGIGGGLAARRLAELGLSVLMIEKGKDLGDTPSGLPMTSAQTAEERLDAGAWPSPLVAHLDNRRVELEGVIGAAVGGTSLYYAATLERPERHDLDDLPERPHPTGGWPVGYGELAPYFERAERYFHISGETDPLDPQAPALPYPARALSSTDQTICDSLRRDGLHPYQTHMAARFLPGCENCFGRRCAKRCKMDGRTAGVLPALETGRVALLDRCEVVEITAGDQVSAITCRREGEEFTLSARAYVVAAGGLGTPALLARSRSESWPAGIGNRHDVLGRNLMFHLSEIVAIWPGKGADRDDGESRSISFRDLYYGNGQRFGLIQSMGLTAGYGEVLFALQNRFDVSRLRALRPLRQALRIPALAAAKLLGPARLFVGVLEDLPYADNRLIAGDPGSDRLEFSYRISPELQNRRAAFRQAMRKAFRANRHIFMGNSPQLNFAHPCGTARFGEDPKTSVLDRDCRVHGVSNLYVADSSFMPTSNGVNPSLTIAANALRVAERIAAGLKS